MSNCLCKPTYNMPTVRCPRHLHTKMEHCFVTPTGQRILTTYRKLSVYKVCKLWKIRLRILNISFGNTELQLKLILGNAGNRQIQC